MLYNFLSATYNLISGTNPHEEDYRLTVDLDSCGFFYSKTKNKEALLCKRNRQLNTAVKRICKSVKYFSDYFVVFLEVR